jgi:hypothetical protein
VSEEGKLSIVLKSRLKSWVRIRFGGEASVLAADLAIVSRF